MRIHLRDLIMYRIGLGVPFALRRPLLMIRNVVRALGFYGGRQSRTYMRYVRACEADPGLLGRKLEELDARLAADSNVGYYIMPSAGSKEGMFQQVNALVHYHLLMAIMAGRVLVVDLQSEKNQYLADEKVGAENAWEHFFEQPFNLGLEDIPDDADVVHGHFRTHWGVWKGDPSRDFGKQDATREDFLRLCARFVRTNATTARYIADQRAALFDSSDKVLGIVIRETDYALGFEHQAPGQRDIDYAAQIERAMRAHGCNRVFVATESRRVYESLDARFPGVVRTNPREFYDNYYEARERGSALVLADIRHDRENDEYLRGLEYITTVFLLAECDVLLGSPSGAFSAALYLNGGAFEAVSVWE